MTAADPDAQARRLDALIARTGSTRQEVIAALVAHDDDEYVAILNGQREPTFSEATFLAALLEAGIREILGREFRTPCATCGGEYDEADPEAVRYHTEGVDCRQSCRCRGKPRCKTCFGSFCFCMEH